jgi:hypothetical protein
VWQAVGRPILARYSIKTYYSIPTRVIRREVPIVRPQLLLLLLLPSSDGRPRSFCVAVAPLVYNVCVRRSEQDFFH